MDFALWSAIIGLLLVVMALSDSVLARLPLSTSMLYVLVGVAVSPLAFGLSALTPTSQARLLEHTAEVVVLLSLFTLAGTLRPGVIAGPHPWGAGPLEWTVASPPPIGIV